MTRPALYQAVGSYLSIEFFGSDGAYFRKDLVGDVDIRDFNQNHWTNSINGTTTVNVWLSSTGEQRLDKQRVVLPDAFATDTLQVIRLTDTGGTTFQRAVLYGVTAQASCLADLSGDGLVDFVDYLAFLNFYSAADFRADINGDGLVDFSDYLEFLNHYDGGC